MHNAALIASSLEKLKQIIASTTAVLNETELLSWQLLVDLATRSAPTKPHTQIQEVPLLQPHDEHEWKDFRTLISNAVQEGAKQTGGFLVDVPSSVGGYKWEKPERPPRLPFHRTRIERTLNGIHCLKLEELRTHTFDIGAHLISWPHHPANIDLGLRAWDEFEALIDAALCQGDTVKCPPYATNCDAATPKERKSLGLSEHSPLSALEGNLLSSTRETYAGVHTPEAFISTERYTPFGAHQEDGKLTAINYLVVGAPKLWIIIPERSGQAFEDLIISRYNLTLSPCGQFVRHHSSFPSRRELEEAGVEYSLIWQQEHQAVATFPGVYHFGINLGKNLAEAMNYDDGTPRTGYMFCSTSIGCPNGPKFISAEGLQRDHAQVEIPRHQPWLSSRDQSASHPHQHSRSIDTSHRLSSIQQTPASIQQAVGNDTAALELRKRRTTRSSSVTGGPHRRQKLRAKPGHGGDDKVARTSQVDQSTKRLVAEHEVVTCQGADYALRVHQSSLVSERRLTVLEQVIQSNEVFIELQDIIQTHGANHSSRTYGNHEGLSVSARLVIIQTLLGNVAYYELLKRCHLVELYKQISGLQFKPTGKRRNQYTEESERTNLLLSHIQPDLNPGDPAYESQRRKCKRLHETGRRLCRLVSTHGDGVLALLRSTYWINEEEFNEESKLFGRQMGPQKDLITAVGDVVKLLFKTNAQVSCTFGLQKWSRKDILEQPCCSGELLSSLKPIDRPLDAMQRPDRDNGDNEISARNSNFDVSGAEHPAWIGWAGSAMNVPRRLSSHSNLDPNTAISSSSSATGELGTSITRSEQPRPVITEPRDEETNTEGSANKVQGGEDTHEADRQWSEQDVAHPNPSNFFSPIEWPQPPNSDAFYFGSEEIFDFHSYLVQPTFDHDLQDTTL